MGLTLGQRIQKLGGLIVVLLLLIVAATSVIGTVTGEVQTKTTIYLFIILGIIYFVTKFLASGNTNEIKADALIKVVLGTGILITLLIILPKQTFFSVIPTGTTINPEGTIIGINLITNLLGTKITNFIIKNSVIIIIILTFSLLYQEEIKKSWRKIIK